MADSTSTSFRRPTRWQHFKCWLGFHPVECRLSELDVKVTAGTAVLEWCPACGRGVWTDPCGVRYVPR